MLLSVRRLTVETCALEPPRPAPRPATFSLAGASFCFAGASFCLADVREVAATARLLGALGGSMDILE